MFVGTLVNAQATAKIIQTLAEKTQRHVTVVACGERWPQVNEDGELRFAIEDYLGAGSILAYLPQQDQSPEAFLCAQAFFATQYDLLRLLTDCHSGRELSERHFTADIMHAAQLNIYDTVAVMHMNHLVHWHDIELLP